MPSPRFLCSFDLETTGVDVTTDRIVTAACLDIDTKGPTGNNTNMHTWLANPGIEIPTGTSDVHGITTEIAQRDGRNHDEVLWEVINHIRSAWAHGAALVVYNAAFDLSMLHVLSGGEFTIDGPVIDPLVIDKGIDQYRRGSRKLVNVAAHYGIEFDEDEAHAADADCLAAARVAWKMLEHNLVTDDLEELMYLQKRWKQEQFSSLADYLARKGDKIDGDGGWPIQQQAFDATK